MLLLRFEVPRGDPRSLAEVFMDALSFLAVHCQDETGISKDWTGRPAQQYVDDACARCIRAFAELTLSILQDALKAPYDPICYYPVLQAIFGSGTTKWIKPAIPESKRRYQAPAEHCDHLCRMLDLDPCCYSYSFADVEPKCKRWSRRVRLQNTVWFGKRTEKL